MLSRNLFFSSLTFSLLQACGDKPSDPTNTDDTGNPEEEITYESGCFTVDGANGYRWLNDAITVANDGSTIDMSSCESGHEEKVIITKSVTLLGSDNFVLVAPVNEAAITIQADYVNLSNFSIESTRSGIVIEDANNFELSDLMIQSVGNYAIKSTNSSGTISDSDFSFNGDGAIRIDGGEVSVESVTALSNTGLGIALVGGGVLNIQDSEISNTQPTDINDISDGFGIFIDEGGTLNSSNNIYDGNVLMNIQSVNGSINMQNDNVSNALSTGIWGEGVGSMTLNNVLVDNNLNYGVINMTTAGLTATDVTISVDPTLSPSIPVEEWQDNGFASMGLFVNTPSIDLNGVEITGYNNCGANLQSENGTTFEVEGLNIHDIGRKGLLVYGAEGNMNNVVLKNIVDLDGLSSDQPDEDGNVADYMSFCGLVDRNIGSVLISSDINMSNVLIDSVEGYGLSILQSNATLDTVYATNNTCASIMVFSSALEATNLDMVGANPTYDALGAMVAGYQATLVDISNSHFSGNTEEYFEIALYGHETLMQVSNSTIENASYGIYSYLTDLNLTGNTIQNNRDYMMFINGDSSKTATFANNQFLGSDDISPWAIYCSTQNLNFSGDSFSQMRGSYTVYGSSCSTEMDGVTFSDINGYSFYASGGDHDISNSSFTNIAQTQTYAPAIYFSANNPMNANVSDVTIENAGGRGIYAATYDTSTAPLMLNIEDSTITNTGDDGIYSYNAETWITSVEINGGNGDGLYLSGNTVSMYDVNISSKGNDGINCFNCNITADLLDIQNNTENGITMDNGSLTVSNTEISNNLLSGIVANNASTVSVTSSILDGNANSGIFINGTESQMGTFDIQSSTISNHSSSGFVVDYAAGIFENMLSNTSDNYGMECSNSTFTSCGNNDLSNNVLGEQTGCDSTCGVDPNAGGTSAQ